MKLNMLKEFLQLAELAFASGNETLSCFYRAKAKALAAA